MLFRNVIKAISFCQGHIESHKGRGRYQGPGNWDTREKIVKIFLLLFPSFLLEGYSMGWSEAGVVPDCMHLFYYPVVLTQLYSISVQMYCYS